MNIHFNEHSRIWSLGNSIDYTLRYVGCFISKIPSSYKVFRPCITESSKQGRGIYINDDIKEGHIVKINERLIHSSTRIANVPRTVHVNGDKEMKGSLIYWR